MCVIVYVDDAACQPDLETLTKCYERNSDQHNTGKGNKDGVGIVWHNAKGVVRYIKGMYKPEEIPALLDFHKVTAPYAIHFRASSVGTPVEGLIHPFPIDLDVPHKLDDSPVNGCVMQNGTWHGWESKLLDAALVHGLEIPDGPWNDARTLAFLMALTGFNTVSRVLSFNNNPSRLLAFLPGGVVKSCGEFTLHEGMWFSQMKWNEEPKKVPEPTTTTVVASNAGATVGSSVTITEVDGFKCIEADNLLGMSEEKRKVMARSLKYGDPVVVTQNACLLKVMSPYDPTSGDFCGSCLANKDFRHCCKTLPEKLECKMGGCFKSVNPLIDKDVCTECLAKMAKSSQK